MPWPQKFGGGTLTQANGRAGARTKLISKLIDRQSGKTLTDCRIGETLANKRKRVSSREKL